MLVTIRPACKTEYRGPTDHRGARIIATHFNTRRRVVIAWDDAAGTEENHAETARALFAATGWPCPPELLRCGINNGGFVWMVAP